MIPTILSPIKSGKMRTERGNWYDNIIFKIKEVTELAAIQVSEAPVHLGGEVDTARGRRWRWLVVFSVSSIQKLRCTMRLSRFPTWTKLVLWSANQSGWYFPCGWNRYWNYGQRFEPFTFVTVVKFLTSGSVPPHLTRERAGQPCSLSRASFLMVALRTRLRQKVFGILVQTPLPLDIRHLDSQWKNINLKSLGQPLRCSYGEWVCRSPIRSKTEMNSILA